MPNKKTGIELMADAIRKEQEELTRQTTPLETNVSEVTAQFSNKQKAEETPKATETETETENKED